MTSIASNHETAVVIDSYAMMRHLFNEAKRSSITDLRWGLSSTHSDPRISMFTEYQHHYSGDRISCESFDFDDTHKETGGYRRHTFTFSQGADINNPNAESNHG